MAIDRTYSIWQFFRRVYVAVHASALIVAALAPIVGIPLFVAAFTMSMLYGGSAICGYRNGDTAFLRSGGAVTEVSLKVYRVMFCLESVSITCLALTMAAGIVYLLVTKFGKSTNSE